MLFERQCSLAIIETTFNEMQGKWGGDDGGTRMYTQNDRFRSGDSMASGKRFETRNHS